MYIKSDKGNVWEYVIGLEIHAQMKSKSKLFSSSSTEFGVAPNTQVSLIDIAAPGTLPILNEFCVKQAVKTGLGLNGKINKLSIFDRKNYFYPDLPQGYQITQFYQPIVQDGWLEIENDEIGKKKIRIREMHLEQDAGKSIHDQSAEYSFIDLNRAGIALLEIVSEPDLSSPEEAVSYIKKLRNILRYLDTCDGDMEKGSLRCDANVSVKMKGEKKLGTRCEIKNVNSVNNVKKAIEYEARRQIELLENNEEVDQETRLFNPDTGETSTMRSKEDAQDYRYFPDPDLPPLEISDEFINDIANNIPELPDEKIKRYTEDLGLNDYDADVIVSDKDISDYFDKVVQKADPKLATNWITSELFGLMNKAGISIKECKIKPNNLIDLLSLIEKKTISGKIAKEVFNIMFETGQDPSSIVQEKGLTQISDVALLEKVVQEILSNNPKSVEQYKSGKDKLFGFFVGQVMKNTQGKADPTLVNKILKEKLDF